MNEAIHYARSPDRIQAKECLASWCSSFLEIKGDRVSGDDPSVLCGLGVIAGVKCAIIGQYPGKTPMERAESQSGMTRPMGYRKMHRLLSLGRKFSLPLLCLIDTPGADASPSACQENQSKMIADSMCLIFDYPHPTLGLILNQGMSGGAMAIALTDRLWMCQHAIFSVINPEGCASILWRDARYATQAAQALKIYASDLLAMNIVDAVVEEGALLELHKAIAESFLTLKTQPQDARLAARFHRWDRPDAGF